MLLREVKENLIQVEYCIMFNVKITPPVENHLNNAFFEVCSAEHPKKNIVQVLDVTHKMI